jgi:parallel beta-helix repeat protein
MHWSAVQVTHLAPIRNPTDGRNFLARFRILAPLAVVLGLLSVSPVARASHIQCGDVITQDTNLDSDVVCPRDFEGSALVIGADGITLDLRGFSVLGTTPDEDVVIVTDRPRRNVTLRGGTVAGVSWEAVPIRAELSDSVIRDLHTEGLGGIYVLGDRNVIRRNHVRASFSGIGVRGDHNRVSENQVWAAEGYGIGASGRGFTLDRNAVTLSQTYGFHDAISVWEFVDIEIQRNVVTSFDSDGIEIGRGSGALIDRNIAVQNANGIRVDDQASDVIVSRNEANDNASGYAESGIGIRVDSASTLITRNTANDNLDYGLWAVPGVVDGGGNYASGNGKADCINVACR